MKINIVLNATLDNIMIDNVVSNLRMQLIRLCHRFNFQSWRTSFKSTGKCTRVRIQRRSVFIRKLLKDLDFIRFLILRHYDVRWQPKRVHLARRFLTNIEFIIVIVGV